MRKSDVKGRFWRNVSLPDENDCMLWRGCEVGCGYGEIQHLGERYRAHRFSYTLLVGPIPEGLVVDHLCRNRRCVNPEHLEPVTAAENFRRGVGPAAINGRKTECPQGHPLSGENVYRDPKGKRRCRTCRAEEWRNPTPRQREQAAANSRRYRARKGVREENS